MLRTTAGSPVAPAHQIDICVAKDPAIQRSYSGGVEAPKFDLAQGERWRIFSNAQTVSAPPGYSSTVMWRLGRSIALVLDLGEHGWLAYNHRPRQLVLENALRLES